MHVLRKTLLAIALLTVTSGCTASSDDQAIIQGPLETGPCPEALVSALSEVVLGQAEALGKGDWETAYTFASPSFRSAIGVEDFQYIVTADYLMLLTFEDATFAQCDVVAENAALFQVVVSSGAFQPVTMVYQMIRDEGQWWISGVEMPQSAIPNA